MTTKTFNKNASADDAGRTNSENGVTQPYKTERKRWFVLTIFVCFTFINSVQWGLYIIISDLVQKYYDVSGEKVDNTAIVFYVAYIPLIFPALWLLEKMGIRFCLLLSCAGLCVGDWIKVIASLDTNLFYLVLVGQGVVAIFSVLAFGLAAKVAAIWFPADQVSLACSLAVFGDQLGTAFGLFLPVIAVSGETKQSIGNGLVNLNVFIACSTTVIFVMAFLFFKRSPKSFPSAAQALANQQQSDSSVLESIKRVCKTKSFLLMMPAYGIQIACFSSYLAVMNSVILTYFQNVAEIHIGLISFLMMMSGVVGSILLGWLLDKTHMYKGLTLLLYACGVLATIANVYVPQQHVLGLVYASNVLMGFFMGGYYSAGIQLAIEITFPVSESLVSSMLLLASQCLGIPFTKLYRWLFDEYGYVQANAFLCGALVVGCCLTAIIPAELRRTLVNANPTPTNSPTSGPA